LPKATVANTGNTTGMLKTFYNSKQSTSGIGGSTTVSSSGGVANNINIIPSGNIYSNNNTNNSSNSTKRALQGLKMNIWMNGIIKW